eukprot:gene25040-biopygen11962
MQDLTDRIVELPQLAGAHQPAVQVANLLLRWCVASKGVHLLRLLPPPLTADFARQADALLLRAFCRLNCLEEGFDDEQRHLYETPLAWGGLGMRSLYDVREAAFVGAWLQCAAHVRNCHGADIPRFDMGWEPGGAVVYGFHRSFQAALAALDAQLGGDNAAFALLGFGPADVLRQEHR